MVSTAVGTFKWPTNSYTRLGAIPPSEKMDSLPHNLGSATSCRCERRARVAVSIELWEALVAAP